MNYFRTIESIHKQYEELIEFQDQLNSLQEDTLDSIKSIIGKSYIQTREKLSMLLRLIQQSCSSRPRSFELYVNLINYLSEHIKNNFSSFELFNDLIQNNYLRYKLYELGFIHLSTVVYYLKNNNNLGLFFLFAFEIKQHDPSTYSHYLAQSAEFREVLKNTTPEIHHDLCSKGLNNQILSQFIRNDDLVQFQSHLSNTNTSINSLIDECQYENRPFCEKKLSLIEYAALFSSVNIFKFLLMNDCILSEDIQIYAIIGGNYDIIHILEEHERCFNKVQFLDTAIEYHQNEVVDYIKDTLEVCFDNESLKSSIFSYNLSVFFQIMHEYKELPEIEYPKMSLLNFIVRHGFVSLVESFYKYIDDSEKEKLINESIQNRRFDVFHFLYSTIVEKEHFPINNQKLLLESVSSGHMQIFQYLLKFNENYFDIKDKMQNGILHRAAAYGDVDIIKFIVTLNPTPNQLNDRNAYGISL